MVQAGQEKYPGFVFYGYLYWSDWMNIPHLAYKFRLDYQIFNMPLDYDHLVYVLQRHFRILKYSEVQTELIQRECFSYTLELSGFALTDEFGQTTIYISDYVNREEQLSVLLHELGHVLCGHCRRMGPVGYGGDGGGRSQRVCPQRAGSCLLSSKAPRSVAGGYPSDYRSG